MRSVLVQALAVMLIAGLALTLIGSSVCVVAARAGIAPDFDQRIALNTQHILMIHNGTEPTCTIIPNPPQHDCFWPDQAHRVFSIDYITPHGVRSLVWFRLPMR